MGHLVTVPFWPQGDRLRKPFLCFIFPLLASGWFPPVEGQVIKGMHPALLDLKTSLKANEPLQQFTTPGVPKKFRQEDLPSKHVVYDDTAENASTGDRTKGIWYYKTKQDAVPVNVRADSLRTLLEQTLQRFEDNHSTKLQLKKSCLESSKPNCLQPGESKGLKRRFAKNRVGWTSLKKNMYCGNYPGTLRKIRWQVSWRDRALVDRNSKHCSGTSEPRNGCRKMSCHRPKAKLRQSFSHL